ncbi:MAG: hypothetical protein ACFWUC_01110 [Oscillospiraceae bacterium]|jgi:archaellum component FlaC
MIREKLKQVKEKSNRNQNRQYQIVLTVFFVLMTVFVTGKLWLPSDVKIQNSEPGTKKTVSAGTSLILNSWQYNRNDGYMEVAFTVQTSDKTQRLSFYPTAHTNVSKNVPMDVSVAYSSADFLLLQIKNVPQNWQVISLWVDTEPNENRSDPAALTGANFLCDARKVEINNSLKPQPELNYEIQSVYNQIDAVQQEIYEQNQKIESANLEIEQLNFDIAALKADQKYQTQDEIQQSNAIIESKTSRINSLKNMIENYQTQIETAQEKLKKLNQKLSDIKSGTLSPYLRSNSQESTVSSSS